MVREKTRTLRSILQGGESGFSLSFDNSVIADNTLSGTLRHRLSGEALEKVGGKEFAVSIGGNVLGTVTPTGENGGLRFQGGENIEENFTRAAQGADVKIPEKIAQLRAKYQEQLGGNSTVDTDIDDFNDALRAFGNPNIKFTPVSSIQKAKEKAAETVSAGNGTMSQKSKLGLGVAVAAALLTAAYTVMR